MKKNLLLLFILATVFFQNAQLLGDEKVYTLANSSNYGILVNDEEWNIKEGTATVDYHARDHSSIKGESSFLPMEFEFFSLFIPANLKYIKNYLNIYAFNTKAVLNISRIEESKDSFLVGGTFIDNISEGYFQIFIQMDQKKNWRAFGTMAKLRFDVIDEAARKDVFKSVASMITPLVN